MTDLDDLYPKVTLTRREYVIHSWLGPDQGAQQHAEREGHVPPGVDSIRVTWFGGFDQPRSITWQWLDGEDPSGKRKLLWFADGPWKGQAPRWIEADVPEGADYLFLTFDRIDDIKPGDTTPAAYRYRVEQREDGLWFGRCVS
ncbi:hypothetical protein [Glycomyces sp. NPDC021274]|uniref:hypothetical protein n=1 Tax=Glycomyces sp. NPDC021274 TaxID=3155120 RepID=UPI0033DCE056